jgi:hypothetical protein
MSVSKTLLKTLIASALTDGYVRIPLREYSEVELKSALSSLGPTTQSNLSVRAKENARPNSLSGTFGTGAFPHHTDFAFRPTPPRVIALCNQTDFYFQRGTALADLTALPVDLAGALKKSAWRLRSNGKVFIVSGCISIGSQFAFRWDPEVLTPANRDAARCASSIPAFLLNHQRIFRWCPRSALLINNWRFTHARESEILGASEDRRLVRYEVW